MSDSKTSLFEVFIALVFGIGALGGGWAAYQSSQWGSTATENYGKAATTMTRGSTVYSEGIVKANRDAELDIQAKELVMTAMTTQDEAVKAKNLALAKYLYTQHMTKEGYLALGYPIAYHSKVATESGKFSDAELERGLEVDLDQKYFDTMVKEGNDKFVAADKIFEEGQKVSGTSTQFGLNGMFFTITLLFGGLALVVKSKFKYAFLALGYAMAAFGCFKLFSLPWYHA